MISHRAGRLSRRIAAAVVLGLSAGPVAAESLTDALIGAYRNSGLLTQNRALLRAADEDVAQSLAQLRPIITYAATADYAPSGSNSRLDGGKLSGTAGLSADILLYDSGSSRLAIEAAKATVLATRQELIAVEQNVLFSAVDAYLSVQSAQAFVDLRENNVELIREQLRAARDRFEVGEVTRTDVATAEAALANAQANLAAARGDLEVAREAYRAAVGRYPGPLESVPNAPATASSEEAAANVAVRSHPEILAAQQQVRVAELNIMAAEASFGPELSAGAQTGVDQDFNADSSVGVTLQGPIYRGGQLTSQLRQAQARRDATRGELYTTQLNIRQSVGQAWSQLQVAQASLSSIDEQIRAARVAFEGIQEEASLGARTTLDVLDAEQDLLDARANRIDAVTQRYAAVYGLLRSMGMLTADHLGLDIPTYDPSAYYNAVRDAPVREVSPQGERLDRIIERLKP
ncbi:outer membrane protein [Tranquillimonas rosea]|uniref:Outer membrane protein n=1 Tax=Tranquillimonas rosea TaxID=641238 RepID=A0A1H9WXX3_9RHOB|nr:TolC family outer membrane protein [Tranquillimonas rosea]SES38756.1 outer membrane protein [Tranquillimonas rosea]